VLLLLLLLLLHPLLKHVPAVIISAEIVCIVKLYAWHATADLSDIMLMLSRFVSQ
jgi:hypothetical protein